MNSSPDIHRFFERDIVEFLDFKAKEFGKSFETNEDKYYRHIQEEDFNSAGESLGQLILDFNKLVRTNVYKDIIYDQIKRCVAEGRKYLNNYTWDNELGKLINKLDDLNELTTEIPDQLYSYEYRRKELEEEYEKESLKFEQARELFREKIKGKQAEISQAINAEDMKSAILHYKSLKHIYERIPKRFEKEKKRIYNDILAYYFQIKKLREKLKREKYLKQIKGRKLKDKKGNKILSVQEILDKIDTIKKNSREYKFSLARNELLSLKHTIDTISNDYIYARNILLDKVEIIQKNLEYAKKLHEESDI